MASASAVLGPLCDGLHSQWSVLKYTAPLPPLSILSWQLETTWWTPLLFAVAGVILGVSHPVLDAAFPAEEPRHGRQPSWGVVLLGIAGFVGQYYASARLDGPLEGVTLGPLPALDLLLAAAAIAQWAVFDGSRQGAGMAALTAVAGPAVEVALIHLGLYSYSHPQLFGPIPTWIAWVYAAGGPAVGNLGRKVSAKLLKSRQGDI